MSSFKHPMRWGPSDRTLKQALRAAFVALVLFGSFSTGYAQEPPLSVPINKLPTRPGDALALDGWLFYPTLRTYTQYSDNLFQSVLNPISVWGWGIAPALTAEWSNGIHTTTLYGNADARDYPTDTELNVLDYKAGVVQKYEALRDLVFSAQADYTHQTITSNFINAIPGAFAQQGTTVLPNGNTVLPNGNIISPSGQIVGQVAPSLNVANSTIQINPSNQYTGVLSVDKILNRGMIGLTGTISRTEFENTGLAENFTTKSLAGRGAIWLGPVFYAYTNDTYASTVTTTQSTTAYRVVGGIGTRKIGLFQASAYYGHQGSDVEESGTAGGEVYGGSLSYFPTPIWTLGAAIDETVNISHQTGATNLVLNTQGQTALTVPISASTRMTSVSLNSNYLLSKQWSVLGRFNYTRVDYLDTGQLDNAYLADVILQYQLTRQLTLSWEYQYSSIVSNAPLTSSKRNFVGMNSVYKF
jgi:hypothetical protein